MTTDAEQLATASRCRLSAPGIRTFIAITDLWEIDDAARRRVLGSPTVSTYQGWIRTAREQGDLILDVDVLTRISAVLGIHAALGILYPDEKAGIAWLRGLHGAPVFGGGSPLGLMTSGSRDSLLITRRFLDAARGGIYMQPNAIDRDFVPYAESDVVFL